MTLMTKTGNSPIYSGLSCHAHDMTLNDFND